MGSSDSKSYTFGFNVRRVREYLLGKCICYSLAPHFLGPINSIRISGGCFLLSFRVGAFRFRERMEIAYSPDVKVTKVMTLN